MRAPPETWPPCSLCAIWPPQSWPSALTCNLGPPFFLAILGGGVGLFWAWPAEFLYTNIKTWPPKVDPCLFLQSWPGASTQGLPPASCVVGILPTDLSGDHFPRGRGSGIGMVADGRGVWQGLTPGGRANRGWLTQVCGVGDVFASERLRCSVSSLDSYACRLSTAALP